MVAATPKTLEQRLAELIADAEKIDADGSQHIDVYNRDELEQLCVFKTYLKANPVTNP